ncbi:MAG: AbrB/MazE/SpoVT family DNA-binding domain-containing protein [Patescibacteria group bacterium]
MTQKVLKVGDSAAVTISKDLLRAFHLKVGDRVQVEHDQKRGAIVVLPVRASKDEAEFSSWTKEFLDQYGPALKALAKK